MTYFFVALYAIVVVVALGQLRSVSRPAGQARPLDKTAQELDLAVDDETATLVTQRLVRRARVGAVGTLVIDSVVLPVYAVWATRTLDSHKPPSFTPLFLLVPWASVMFGQIAARSGLMMYEVAGRTKRAGLRVARAQVPALTDYVRPLELWTARLVVLLVAPTTTALLIVSTRGTRKAAFVSTPLMIAGVLFAAGVLLAVELAARRLLTLAQPASTLVELAWDDALRSRQLRELYLSTAGVGLIVAMYSVIALDLPGWTQMPLFFGALGAVLVTGHLGKPAAYYRRRLWPAPSDRRQAAT